VRTVFKERCLIKLYLTEGPCGGGHVGLQWLVEIWNTHRRF